MDGTRWCDGIHTQSHSQPTNTVLGGLAQHNSVRSFAHFTPASKYIGTHSPIYVYLGLTRKHSAVACLRWASTNTQQWMSERTNESTKNETNKQVNWLHRKIEGYVWYTSNNFFNELVPTRLLTYISNWKFWVSERTSERTRNKPTNGRDMVRGMW